MGIRANCLWVRAQTPVDVHAKSNARHGLLRPSLHTNARDRDAHGMWNMTNGSLRPELAESVLPATLKSLVSCQYAYDYSLRRSSIAVANQLACAFSACAPGTVVNWDVDIP